jgi:tRNA 2-thiouridine synthesizing protein A
MVEAMLSSAMTGETLDLRGLKCPLPALLARRAMARLAPGTSIMVLADDPLARIDIPHMCHEEGHRVETVTTRDSASEFRLSVRTAAGAPLSKRDGE